MSPWRQLLLLALTATAPYAHTALIHVPQAPTKIEWTVLGASPDWDITVTFDAAHCDIYCEIHRRPEAFGRGLSLPPAIALQIFPDGVSRPIRTIVDPGGDTLPFAHSRTQITLTEDGLSGKGLLPISLGESRSPALKTRTVPQHLASAPRIPYFFLTLRI
jgi:hypothetical protein